MLVASMNPLPMRLLQPSYQRMPLHPGAGAALSQPHLRAVARPHRHTGGNHACAFPGTSGYAARRKLHHHPRACIKARDIQRERFSGEKGVHCNAQMTPKMIAQHARPSQAAMNILQQAMTRFDMSARAYDRILKVARTMPTSTLPPT